MISILLGLSLITSAQNYDPDAHQSGDPGFDYYFGEFLDDAETKDQPMQKLITARLAESMFETTDSNLFQKHIQMLLDARDEFPDKLDQFARLDGELAADFQAHLQQAKKKRLLYTEVGAVVGALVAIPVGLAAGSRISQMGAKVLWIAVPIGALSGAGAGFLLGNLLLMPKYHYQPGTLSKDLKSIDDELKEMN